MCHDCQYCRSMEKNSCEELHCEIFRAFRLFDRI
jgi:hypothetical protein